MVYLATWTTWFGASRKPRGRDPDLAIRTRSSSDSEAEEGNSPRRRKMASGNAPPSAFRPTRSVSGSITSF